MTSSATREFDVVVVGGGVAGLGAAGTAAEEGWRTAVAVGVSPGGRLANFARAVALPFAEPGLLGSTAAGVALERALDAGVTPIFEQAAFASAGPPWELDCGEDRPAAPAVVVATGRSDPLLGLPGEADLVGNGISYCASCDGPLFAGERVVVVGDSDWAVEEVLELADVVAAVTLVVDTPRLRCTPARAARLAGAAGVDVITGGTVTGIGTAGSGVESVTVTVGGAARDVPAKAVFALIDGTPRTAGLPPGVGCSPGGGIRVDDDFATDVAGLFAVGDVTRSRAESLARNSGDGVAAGLAVSRWLGGRVKASVAGDG